MNYLFAFLSSLVYVGLRASQQLNVAAFEYRRVVPTSMAMAACEVFIMVNVVKSASDWTGLSLLALAIGLGAGIGCMAAMKLHQRRKNAPH